MTHGKRHLGDLSNRRLILAIVLPLVAAAFAIIIIAGLPGIWSKSGGPLLQSAAALGAFLLLASFAAVLAKRFGKPGKQRFHSHVWLASVGVGLVVLHGAGGLLRPPAVLLALLAVLTVLGLWSRTRGSRLMAGTFGTKRAAFTPPDMAKRAELAGLIEQKRALLAFIAPGADEGLFSPQFRHWLKAPIRTFQYERLAATERRMIGADRALHPLQARWRIVHRAAAWAFVLGLIGHVFIVMVFAGYAAGGRDIYWLHFADWSF